MVHKSKVDLWLALLLAVIPLAPIYLVVERHLAGDRTETLIALGVLVLVAVVFGGLIFPMYYQVVGDHLLVRSGLVRSRYPLAKIRSVRPSRNPLSSPALSLDRLAIDHGGRFPLLISPRDREAFYADLLAAASHLVREGEALVLQEKR